MKQVNHAFNRRLPRKINTFFPSTKENIIFLKAKDMKHSIITKTKSLYSPDDNKKQLKQIT